ncbi:MAG: hypothetical protein ACRDCN_02025 [Tannerellaceae bacterium]
MGQTLIDQELIEEINFLSCVFEKKCAALIEINEFVNNSDDYYNQEVGLTNSQIKEFIKVRKDSNYYKFIPISELNGLLSKFRLVCRRFDYMRNGIISYYDHVYISDERKQHLMNIGFDDKDIPEKLYRLPLRLNQEDWVFSGIINTNYLFYISEMFDVRLYSENPQGIYENNPNITISIVGKLTNLGLHVLNIIK